MSNCIFLCIFNNPTYVDMLFLLLESLHLYGKVNADETNLLIYTTTEFQKQIQTSRLINYFTIHYEINDQPIYNTIDGACKSSLDLFSFKTLTLYNFERFLYLDIDILVKNDIAPIFNLIQKDILYVREEGILGGDCWGKELFSSFELEQRQNQGLSMTAFSSGILLFKNCITIQNLFTTILHDIEERASLCDFMDQPFFVYNAVKYQQYDNQLLIPFVVNSPNISDYENKPHIVFCHLCGSPGNGVNKLNNMKHFIQNIY